MATERVNSILNSLSQRVEELIPCHRFYVVLHDLRKREISFPLVREESTILPVSRSPWITRPLSSERILPDLIVLDAKGLLFESDLPFRLEQEKIQYWPDEKEPNSWIGVPINIGKKDVLGALVVENWQKSHSFSKTDESTLVMIARQSAIAIENVYLYEKLEQKVVILGILNKIGQQLTRGLIKQQEKEILEIIYKGAEDLQLDTQNMYIAFYYSDSNKPNTETKIYGSLGFGLAFDDGKPAFISDRPVQNGLTEYVVRTKQSFNVPDVDRAYRELAQDQIGKIPRSWLGVPMLSEGVVFGVIALRNNEFEQFYTEDDQEILELLANQAAIALQNLRSYEAYQREQNQRIATEKMSVMSVVAAEFAHKMNNLAGTIPVRINLAKEQLNPDNSRDAKIIENLNKIEKETQGILQAAQEIRQSNDAGMKEDVNVNQLIETAIARAGNIQNITGNKVKVLRRFTENLPLIRIEKNTFSDILTNIIKNGMESISGEGSVTIYTQIGKLNESDCVEIKVSDTGKGIAPSELSQIFDLFYTTKGQRGLGFGLWRDKIFIKKIGGEIDVDSKVNKGSTFAIRIPVNEISKI